MQSGCGKTMVGLMMLLLLAGAAFVEGSIFDSLLRKALDDEFEYRPSHGAYSGWLLRKLRAGLMSRSQRSFFDAERLRSLGFPLAPTKVHPTRPFPACSHHLRLDWARCRAFEAGPRAPSLWGRPRRMSPTSTTSSCSDPSLLVGCGKLWEAYERGACGRLRTACPPTCNEAAASAAEAGFVGGGLEAAVRAGLRPLPAPRVLVLPRLALRVQACHSASGPREWAGAGDVEPVRRGRGKMTGSGRGRRILRAGTRGGGGKPARQQA